MSQRRQVVSMPRYMNQITACKTNGVIFLLGICEPPSGLLCSAEGTELPEGLWPSWTESREKQQKWSVVWKTWPLRNEHESWEHIIKRREDIKSILGRQTLLQGLRKHVTVGVLSPGVCREWGDQQVPTPCITDSSWPLWGRDKSLRQCKILLKRERMTWSLSGWERVTDEHHSQLRLDTGVHLITIIMPREVVRSPSHFW